MFFVASKILWTIFAPGASLPLLMVVGAVGLASRWARPARALLLLALGLYLVLAIGPTGAWLLRPLENRFPAPSADRSAPTGIIVLGGAIDEAVSAARHAPMLNDTAGRMTTAVALARRFPSAQLVFTGGSGHLLNTGTNEATWAAQVFSSLGIGPERLRIEDRSRDTYENAVFTRALIHPRPGDVWLLVTSAFHMPRAVGAFRKAHFPVVPWPVDYKLAPQPSLDDFATAPQGLQRTERALREYIGLLAYYLSGRSDALFPAPALANGRDGIESNPAASLVPPR